MVDEDVFGEQMNILQKVSLPLEHTHPSRLTPRHLPLLRAGLDRSDSFHTQNIYVQIRRGVLRTPAGIRSFYRLGDDRAQCADACSNDKSDPRGVPYLKEQSVDNVEK